MELRINRVRINRSRPVFTLLRHIYLRVSIVSEIQFKETFKLWEYLSWNLQLQIRNLQIMAEIITTILSLTNENYWWSKNQS